MPNPSCAGTTLTGPLQFPYRARNLATSAVGRSSDQPALGGQVTYQRRGAADGGEYRQAAGSFCARRSRLIRMAPHAPRRSGPRHALVLRIGSTRVAVPSPGGQALLKRRKPAIRSSAASIVIDAPRIALRFSGFFDPDDCRENF